MEKHSLLNKSPKERKNIYMMAEAIRLKNAKSRLWKRCVATKTKFDRDKYIYTVQVQSLKLNKEAMA